MATTVGIGSLRCGSKSFWPSVRNRVIGPCRRPSSDLEQVGAGDEGAGLGRGEHDALGLVALGGGHDLLESSSICRAIVLTDLPGWSNVTIITPSASTVVRRPANCMVWFLVFIDVPVAWVTTRPGLVHFRSSSIAAPWPPPTHRAAMAEVDVAALHLVQQRQHQPRAGRADRVAQRDARRR